MRYGVGGKALDDQENKDKIAQIKKPNQPEEITVELSKHSSVETFFTKIDCDSKDALNFLSTNPAVANSSPQISIYDIKLKSNDPIKIGDCTISSLNIVKVSRQKSHTQIHYSSAKSKQISEYQNKLTAALLDYDLLRVYMATKNLNKKLLPEIDVKKDDLSSIYKRINAVLNDADFSTEFASVGVALTSLDYPQSIASDNLQQKLKEENIRVNLESIADQNRSNVQNIVKNLVTKGNLSKLDIDSAVKITRSDNNSKVTVDIIGSFNKDNEYVNIGLSKSSGIYRQFKLASSSTDEQVKLDDDYEKYAYYVHANDGKSLKIRRSLTAGKRGYEYKGDDDRWHKETTSIDKTIKQKIAEVKSLAKDQDIKIVQRDKDSKIIGSKHFEGECVVKTNTKDKKEEHSYELGDFDLNQNKMTEIGEVFCNKEKKDLKLFLKIDKNATKDAKFKFYVEHDENGRKKFKEYNTGVLTSDYSRLRLKEEGDNSKSYFAHPQHYSSENENLSRLQRARRFLFGSSANRKIEEDKATKTKRSGNLFGFGGNIKKEFSLKVVDGDEIYDLKITPQKVGRINTETALKVQYETHKLTTSPNPKESVGVNRGIVSAALPASL